MKNAFLGFAILSLTNFNSIFAAETLTEESGPNWKEVSYNAELLFSSRYLGDGIAASEEPVLQPSANLGWMNFTAGLWANMDMNETDRQGKFSEVDLNLTYDYEIAGFTITPEYVHYIFPNQPGAINSGELALTVAYSLGEAFDLHTNHRIDIKENKGAYIGAAGPGFTHEFNDKFGMSSAIDLAWASGKYNEGVVGVKKTGLLSLVATADATWHVIPQVYMKPGIQWSSMMTSDFRDQAKADGLDRDIFTASLAFGAEF